MLVLVSSLRFQTSSSVFDRARSLQKHLTIRATEELAGDSASLRSQHNPTNCYHQIMPLGDSKGSSRAVSSAKSKIAAPSVAEKV